MVLPNPAQPFVWGAGGSLKTPEQVAREREIASALMMEGMDYSPVGHWLAGAARASQGLVGGLKNRWADEAETAGRDAYQQRWDSVFGGGQGGSDIASALMGGSEPKTALGAANAMAAVPSGERAAYIRSGLVNRGLPEHIADAFLLNMQDESGLNPGINEAQPLVPGSRGGYGLYQLTGPRRTAYEAFAGQRGVDPSDIDAQLDFLMSELQGPEARAAQSIFAAQDTPTAAAAIVKNFLRPAEEHRARRESAYLGGAAPVQVAQAGGMGAPDIAALIGLASDPWANDSQRSIANALFGQAIQTQAQANDPLRQLQIQSAQQGLEKGALELEAMRNPAAPAPVFEGGQWWDTSSGMPTALTDRAVDPTSGMQNFDFLTGLGFDQAAAADRAFSGGVQVNIPGQPNIGSIPPGYSAVQDEAGAWSMAPIPGSPAAIEAEEAAAQAGARQDQAGRYADIVTQDIDRALGLTGGDTTGIVGTLLQNVPGTNSRNLDALLSTIRANIGFDRLQQMREASPTGGALGAVSEFENRLLQSTLGNLEQSQTEEQLRQNLQRVKDTYLDIIHGPGNRPGEQNQSTVDPSDIDALLELYR